MKMNWGISFHAVLICTLAGALGLGCLIVTLFIGEHNDFVVAGLVGGAGFGMVLSLFDGLGMLK